MASLLLDTNAIVAYLNGDTVVEQVISDADEVFLPVIAYGEACYGAEKSNRKQKNLDAIEHLASELTVLDCNTQTARLYGQIEQNLRAKGRPIPQNDVWIAAIARQYALTVLTKDKHFENIDDLKMQDW